MIERARRMRRDRRGLGQRAVVALEVALIAPVLLLLSLGTVEFAMAVRVQLSVNAAAHAVANLIAEQSDVTTAQLNDFFIAGQDCNEVNSNVLSISATSVTFAPGSTTGTIAWDAASVSPSYVAAPADLLSISAGLGATSGGSPVGGDSVIVVQATGVLNLPVPFGPIPTSFTISSTAFARPRTSFAISLN
jgi:Flp pilus assembly protein TadG